MKPSEDSVACIRKLRMDQGEGGDKWGVRGSVLVAGLVPKDQEFARTDQYGCPLHVDLPPSLPALRLSFSLFSSRVASLGCVSTLLSLPSSLSLFLFFFLSLVLLPFSFVQRSLLHSFSPASRV